MIPKIIWQTYETPFNDLIPDAKKCIQTWIDKNPTWEYRYMSSEDRESFVLNEFGKDWYDLFTSCNLGVIKANIWRCMITYTYGGVYCDLDTICNEPIESWIKPEYDMTISRDDDGNVEDFAIYVFASKPKSKVLELILKQIKINLENNKLIRTDVIDLSGETVWSNIIKDCEDKYNIYCYIKGSNIFKGKAVDHLGTFKKWDKDGYISWTKTI